MFLGDRLLPPVDLVLPRIGASITNYGLAVVRQFDMMGIPVLNNAIAIARSRDKLRAMQLLTKKDIDVPKTVCARTPDSVDAALDFIGGTPAIIKLHQGTQGIGTMIADTAGNAFALRGVHALRWTPTGYDRVGARPSGMVAMLTPLTSVAALQSEYRPQWHSSATLHI